MASCTVGARASPSGLTATPSLNGGNGQITLAWTGVTGATGYVIYRSAGSSTNMQTLTTVSTSGYQDSDIVDGTNYYYQVAAIEGDKLIGLDERELLVYSSSSSGRWRLGTVVFRPGPANTDPSDSVVVGQFALAATILSTGSMVAAMFSWGRRGLLTRSTRRTEVTRVIANQEVCSTILSQA